MAGSTDSFGVVARYATGSVRTNWNENFRDDGKRFDFTSLGTALKNYELRGYFAWNNPADDECSGKLGGGKHSSGSRPQCYDIGVDLNSGQSRLRIEDEHPSGYETIGPGGKGVGMSSNFVGYNFIKWNQTNGVRLEVWQDTGSNGSAPSNQWNKVGEWLDNEYNWQDPPSDHQATIRIDGNNGASGLQWKWIALQEIGGSDSGDGTGGGTPGTGGGGFQGLDPYGGFVGGTTGGTPAIISQYVPTFADLNGDGIADQTGEFIGGSPNPNWAGGSTGSDVPGTWTQEPEIITVSKRYRLKWSIRERPIACNADEDTEEGPIEELYSCGDGGPDPAITTLDMYHDGPCVKIGVYVAMDKSMVLADLVKEFLARVKRVGTPGGFCYWEIYDGDNTLIYQTPADEMILAANVPLNTSDLVIKDHKNPNQLQLFDKLVFCYGEEEGEGDVDNKLVYKFNEKDAIDGAKTCLVYFSGTKWIVDPAKDFSGKFAGTNANA